jgi:hypothetical protein
VRFGSFIAALDALSEVDLLGLGEEGGLADLVQVHLDGVAGVAGAEVAFEDLLDKLGVFFLVVEGVVQEICIHDFYAVLAKETVDLLDLLGREVDLLEEVEDFTGFQCAGLLSGLEEFLDLLYVPKVTLGLQLLLWIRSRNPRHVYA